ncbi:MAG: DNA cytosine methyltransferase [Candidatus Thorarchaeota archaeon]|nr:MAG: DNA cytosine methyltransferase [Candidatus Thorarchaeota archaeon]
MSFNQKTFKYLAYHNPVNSISLVSVESPVRENAAELLYNHICSSLSDLDMEMIRSVPQGGNWQDIPEKVVEKSARLTQIRNSGGRTTYYGRLSNNLPSYTVNTYFNRPGNGTFVHPHQDRLISMREAARLQSFPDHYRFLGSYSSRYKQIGNAVPPFLARAVADQIQTGLVLDMFSGAGGLSEGFIQAGNDIVLATDSNSHMCETYRYNHPKTKVVLADVDNPFQSKELLEEIERTLKGRTLTTIVGGPPCQGFSTAGRRIPSDSRNTLVLKMLDFVNSLAPENVLIENVPGMKWIKRGKAIGAVVERLEAGGYTTTVLDLKAEEYCVPQRRRRVFVVANRNNEPLFVPKGALAPIVRGKTRKDSRPGTKDLPPPVNVSEAVSDLPSLSSGEGEDRIEYIPDWTKTDYQRLMRGNLELGDFITKRAEQG